MNIPHSDTKSEMTYLVRHDDIDLFLSQNLPPKTNVRKEQNKSNVQTTWDRVLDLDLSF